MGWLFCCLRQSPQLRKHKEALDHAEHDRRTGNADCCRNRVPYSGHRPHRTPQTERRGLHGVAQPRAHQHRHRHSRRLHVRHLGTHVPRRDRRELRHRLPHRLRARHGGHPSHVHVRRPTHPRAYAQRPLRHRVRQAPLRRCSLRLHRHRHHLHHGHLHRR